LDELHKWRHWKSWIKGEYDVHSDHLKFCHFIEDREGRRAELRYPRDRAGHEVDFLVTLDGKIWFAAEAKVSAEKIDPSLKYFTDRLDIPQSFQVVLDGKRNALINGIHTLPAHIFLSALVCVMDAGA